MFDLPILFIVYNRPDLTEVMINCIKGVRPRYLYIAADGFREKIKDDKIKVDRVRDLLINTNWDTKVKFLFQKKNLGCRLAVKSALDWFFEYEEMGIILEDDTLPSVSFFKFCEEMLYKFRFNEQIMSISGTIITTKYHFQSDFVFSNFPLMWGWATWKRAWLKYDFNMIEWKRMDKNNWLNSLNLGGFKFRIVWQYIFDLTSSNSVDTWDYQWIFTCWFNKGLTIIPTKNLVSNIGFSEDATHTKKNDSYLSNLTSYELNWPLNEPKDILPNHKIDFLINKFWFKVSWYTVFKIYIKKALLYLNQN